MRITSRADLRQWIAADRRDQPLLVYASNPIHRYLLVLRLCEYAENLAYPVAAQKVARMFLRRRGRRLGFSIPPNTCGPGLRLAHWGSIVISARAKIGANCVLHSGVNVGEHHGQAPTIGDDCYLAPGAKLFGPITIGDRSKIGANAVVTKSFPADSTLLGIPATAYSRSQRWS